MSNTYSKLKAFTSRHSPWFALAAIVLATSGITYVSTVASVSSTYRSAIERLERSHKYQMGQQRTVIAAKLDKIYDHLLQNKPTPAISVKQAADDIKGLVNEVTVN